MAGFGFGPAAARAATERPAAPSSKTTARSYFKDASTSSANDGTVLNAAFLNHVAGNLQYVCDQSGIDKANEQTDDTYLYRAIVKVIQSGGLSGGALVAAIDSALGSTDWRNSSGGTTTPSNQWTIV